MKRIMAICNHSRIQNSLNLSLFFEKGGKMRTSLVLIMVLGCATSAQAGLSLYMDHSIAPSETFMTVGSSITIGVHSSDQSFWSGYIEMSTLNWPEVTDVASLDFDHGVAHGIGNQGSIRFDSDGMSVGISVGSTTVPNDVIAGEQYYLPLIAERPGVCLIGLYSASEYPIQTMVIYTPEPMTITLLSLGGLMICRRGKK